MVDLGDPPRPLDPENVPVRVVNGIPQFGVIGSLVSLTLTTDRIGFGADGKLKSEMVVAARLRFDLEMARILRDVLNSQIELLSPPTNDKAN